MGTPLMPIGFTGHYGAKGVNGHQMGAGTRWKRGGLMSDPGDWSCEPWAVDSSTVASISSQVLLYAVAIDEVASRLAVAAALDWESPAGRNFRAYLMGQAGGVRRTSEQFRESAARVAAFAATLRTHEYRQLLEHLRQ